MIVNTPGTLPTASDTREEYCNHVPEAEKNEEDEKQENANFGRKRYYAPRYLGFLRNVRRGSRLYV